MEHLRVREEMYSEKNGREKSQGVTRSPCRVFGQSPQKNPPINEEAAQDLPAGSQ